MLPFFVQDLIPETSQPLVAKRLKLRDRFLSDVIFTNARDPNSVGIKTVGQLPPACAFFTAVESMLCLYRM